MTPDLIALQKRADDAMTLLRNSGHRAEADVILEMRQLIYSQQERINTIHRAIAGAIRKESDR